MGPYMKLIISLTLILITNSSFSYSELNEENKELFEQRVHEVLELKKVSMLKKIATKINTNYEQVEKNISFTKEEKELIILGHVTGSYGICELSGKINIIETSIVGKCISDDHKVSIIWP